MLQTLGSQDVLKSLYGAPITPAAGEMLTQSGACNAIPEALFSKSSYIKGLVTFMDVES